MICRCAAVAHSPLRSRAFLWLCSSLSLFQSIEACARLNFALEALAPQFPHVRFCRLRSREAMAHYKDAGLPTLLVYKGGKMVTSAVRCTDVLPKHFSDLDVARLLQAYAFNAHPAHCEAAPLLHD